jgi:predicted O-methyltransferase YrrM
MHTFVGEFIDDDHRALSRLPVEGGLICGAVGGWLRPADALALYELAYFARGNTLELGTAWGLSTGILCTAVRNAGTGGLVVSIEIERKFRRATSRAIRAAGLCDHHRMVGGEAGDEVDALIRSGATFGAVFIDHDHAYGPTERICRQLDSALRTGGIALFHDLNDARNRTEPHEYGVHRAVAELLERPGYVLAGMVGCCCAVRRVAL